MDARAAAAFIFLILNFEIELYTSTGRLQNGVMLCNAGKALMTPCHERQRAILRTRPGFPGPNTPNLEKILIDVEGS